MQSIIVYYSYSGNTKIVVEILSEYLKEKGPVEVIELVTLDESDKFFTQAARALIRKRARIEAVNFALAQYDLVCLGTPVWAFGPAPAMNTYLDKCTGLNDKSVVLFTTYGSGTGNRNCLNYMQHILTKKGAKDFKRFSIQQFKVNNKEFVLAKIKEMMRL